MADRSWELNKKRMDIINAFGVLQNGKSRFMDSLRREKERKWSYLEERYYKMAGIHYRRTQSLKSIQQMQTEIDIHLNWFENIKKDNAELEMEFKMQEEAYDQAIEQKNKEFQAQIYPIYAELKSLAEEKTKKELFDFLNSEIAHFNNFRPQVLLEIQES